LMLDLLEGAETFLEPRHYRSDPAGYTRNLIYAAPDKGLSLYALVWLPGQWTPVHDHGSWGVVGVHEGVLEERSYVRISPDREVEESSPGRSAQLTVTSQRPGRRSGATATCGTMGKCCTQRDTRPAVGSSGACAAMRSARPDSIFWIRSR